MFDRMDFERRVCPRPRHSIRSNSKGLMNFFGQLRTKTGPWSGAENGLEWPTGV